VLGLLPLLLRKVVTKKIQVEKQKVLGFFRLCAVSLPCNASQA